MLHQSPQLESLVAPDVCAKPRGWFGQRLLIERSIIYSLVNKRHSSRSDDGAIRELCRESGAECDYDLGFQVRRGARLMGLGIKMAFWFCMIRSATSGIRNGHVSLCIERLKSWLQTRLTEIF